MNTALSEEVVSRDVDTKTGDVIIVRLARHDDYDAVMAINDAVYEGLDYLRTEYHNYIRDRGSIGYVLVINGDVVGFRNLKLADKKTVIGMAARTHAKVQGRNLFDFLSQKSDVHFASRFPEVTSIIWTSLFLPSYKKMLLRDKDKPGGARLLADHFFQPITVSRGSLSASGLTPYDVIDNHLCGLDLSRAKRLSANEVVALSKDPSEFRRLTKLPYVIMGTSLWRPHAWDLPGFREAVQNNTFLVTRDHDNRLLAISYASAHKCSTGVSYAGHFHGDNIEDYKVHWLKHLLHFYRILPPDAVGGCSLSFQRGLQNEARQFIRSMKASSISSSDTPVQDGAMFIKSNL